MVPLSPNVEKSSWVFHFHACRSFDPSRHPVGAVCLVNCAKCHHTASKYKWLVQRANKINRSISLSVKVVSCLRMRWLWVGPSRSRWQLSAADNQRLPLSANVYQATATPLQRSRDLWNLNWRQSIIESLPGETKKLFIVHFLELSFLENVALKDILNATISREQV